jgi:hypothetical protein
MTDNVIQFPQRSKNPIPKDDAEIALNMNMIKHNHINETLATIIPLLFTNIELAGFDIGMNNEEDEEEDENIKDGALIVESIRSLLCKLHEMSHPFQDLSELLFLEEEEGGLRMADKIKIVLNKKGDSES